MLREHISVNGRPLFVFKHISILPDVIIANYCSHPRQNVNFFAWAFLREPFSVHFFEVLTFWF